MNNFQYFGLFIDNETKNTLINYLKTLFNDNFFNKADKLFIDHCTLLHKSQLNGNEYLYDKLESLIGEQFQLKLIEFGCSTKVSAFKVQLQSNEDLCINEIPHITIATYNGGKPVDSNNITEWVKILPIEITTTLYKR